MLVLYPYVRGYCTVPHASLCVKFFAAAGERSTGKEDYPACRIVEYWVSFCDTPAVVPMYSRVIGRTLRMAFRANTIILYSCQLLIARFR